MGEVYHDKSLFTPEFRRFRVIVYRDGRAVLDDDGKHQPGHFRRYSVVDVEATSIQLALRTARARARG